MWTNHRQVSARRCHCVSAGPQTAAPAPSGGARRGKWGKRAKRDLPTPLQTFAATLAAEALALVRKGLLMHLFEEATKDGPVIRLFDPTPLVNEVRRSTTSKR